jgi:hypothetical protein
VAYQLRLVVHQWCYLLITATAFLFLVSSAALGDVAVLFAFDVVVIAGRTRLTPCSSDLTVEEISSAPGLQARSPATRLGTRPTRAYEQRADPRRARSG